MTETVFQKKKYLIKWVYTDYRVSAIKCYVSVRMVLLSGYLETTKQDDKIGQMDFLHNKILSYMSPIWHKQEKSLSNEFHAFFGSFCEQWF